MSHILASYIDKNFLKILIPVALQPETLNEEESGSSHHAFTLYTPFFHDGGYKIDRIIKLFSEEIRKWIYLSKACYHVKKKSVMKK